MDRNAKTEELLEFYMGKNTPQRQEFIIENLRIEEDMLEESA
jgi:topoisomerase-4 subunit B